MATKPKAIDEYLSALDTPQKAALEKLRKMIKAAAPQAEEGISYGLAAFRLEGKPLAAIGATSNHCAFYPMSGSIVQAHEDDLKGYETSKGTIRFPAEKPLPASLVRKLVRARVAEMKKPHVHYHKDGTVWAKGRLLDGVCTGYWEWFRKDGTKLRSGHFENGEQVGEWITYDRNGGKHKVTTIKPKPQKA